MPAKKSKSVQPPPPPPPKRPAHRPLYQPTPDVRAKVAAMVLADVDQDTIARAIGISPRTLRRAYRRELDTSYAIVKADVVAKLVTKARAGDVKCMIFYLSTHGWAESARIVVADGGLDDSALSSLSDAEIEARLAKLDRASRRPRPAKA